jgi:GT2 family glycosyltransferase
MSGLATVIIPVLNRYDLLERAIGSLGEVERLVIIDNGDNLGDEDLDLWRSDGQMEGIGKTYLLTMPSNLGVATSWNLGIKATPESDGWLLLNSDAYFTDGGFSVFAGETEGVDVLQAGRPPWCCTWISSRAIAEVGLFCERFYPAYCEDMDWQRRAQVCGIGFAGSSAHVQHDNSSTIEASPNLKAHNARTHAANAGYFDERWDGLADNELPRDADWRLATRLANSWHEGGSE